MKNNWHRIVSADDDEFLRFHKRDRWHAVARREFGRLSHLSRALIELRSIVANELLMCAMRLLDDRDPVKPLFCQMVDDFAAAGAAELEFKRKPVA